MPDARLVPATAATPGGLAAPLAEARARAMAAVQETGCTMASVRPYHHPSDQDCFYEAQRPDGLKLFFKAHLGTGETLRQWPEPAGARRAERAGIGTKVVATQTPGVLVTHRLAGEPMTRQEGTHPHNIKQVMQRLYALHHSEPSDAEAVVPSHADPSRNNAALLVARGLSTQAYADRMVHQADWLDGQLAACEVAPQIRFGDSHFGNWIVVGDEVFAIDLASCGFGDPFADIARYAFCIRTTPETLQGMLDAYLEPRGRPATATERRRLGLIAMAQDLDYLGYWILHAGPESAAAQGMLERVHRNEALFPGCPRLEQR